jgi:hypothetical protein
VRPLSLANCYLRYLPIANLLSKHRPLLSLNTDGALSRQPSSAIIAHPPRLAVAETLRIAAEEKAVVWFSTNQFWELAVWKLWARDDRLPQPEFCMDGLA